MTNTTRKQTDYYKLVGRIDQEYYFCDYIFNDGDFKGASATVIRPVPLDEYNERMKPENVRDEYRDLWAEAVSNGQTDDSLDDWMEYNDCAPYWDDSGSRYWDVLTELGLKDDEYPVFECIGGGRSFSRGMAWDEIFDQSLLDEIEKVEA